MLKYNGSEHYTPLELLGYWIVERDKIRLQKLKGLPPPWSEDPIFQTIYFTNVRREDDKVTQWIRDYYSPYVDHSLFALNIVLARLVNKPATLNAIEFLNNEETMARQVEEGFEIATKTQSSVWGAAYIVTTHGQRMGKVAYLVQQVLPAALNATRGNGWLYGNGYPYPRCANAYSALKAVSGLGSFLAAQVVADLKNTQGHELWNAPDKRTFVAPGPGSIRGLSHIIGKRITSESAFTGAINTIRTTLILNYKIPLDDWGVDNQDLQNCLCEFGKYYRVRYLKGRSKRKYNGRGN